MPPPTPSGPGDVVLAHEVALLEPGRQRDHGVVAAPGIGGTLVRREGVRGLRRLGQLAVEQQALGVHALDVQRAPGPRCGSGCARSSSVGLAVGQERPGLALDAHAVGPARPRRRPTSLPRVPAPGRPRAPPSCGRGRARSRRCRRPPRGCPAAPPGSKADHAGAARRLPGQALPRLIVEAHRHAGDRGRRRGRRRRGPGGLAGARGAREQQPGEQDRVTKHPGKGRGEIRRDHPAPRSGALPQRGAEPVGGRW